MTIAYPLKAIFGTSRSGSTWLGAIINSHPDVAYRFEPFHRLIQQNSSVDKCKKLLQSPSFSEKDLPFVYKTLIKAHPLTHKPPFFQKNSSLPSHGIWMWSMSRVIPIFNYFYEKIYTPKGSPPLVFKEVNQQQIMNTLLAKTSTPIVYIIRHPCGTILSQYKGQQEGKMPTGRHGVLSKMLEEHDITLAHKYVPRLSQMTELEKTALLWRIDVEKALTAVKESNDQALLIYYEKLCDDPAKYTQLIFKHFGLSYAQQTETFLHDLSAVDFTSKSSKSLGRSRDWMDSYFTVYRNPQTSKNSWKKKYHLKSKDKSRI